MLVPSATIKKNIMGTYRDNNNDNSNSRGRGDSYTASDPNNDGYNGTGDSPRTGQSGWQPDSVSNQVKEMRSQYGTYRSDGTDFSPDNPYYIAMGSSNNKQDLAALREQAIQWEANQADYQRQLSDQRALRDEDWFYNSPSQQIARERAAGINPDLQGGTAYSGGSGSSSSTPPSIAPTDLENMSNPYDTSDKVFAGMSSAANLISSITSFGTGAVSMVKELGTLGDFFSMSSSSARISEVGANVAEQTQAAQISDKNIESATRRAIAVGDFAAGHLTGDEDDEKIREIVSQYFPNDQSFADEVIRHSSSPAVQAQYNSMKLAANKAQAEFEAAPFLLLKNLTEKSYEHQMYKLFADTNWANLSSLISSNLVVDDNYTSDVAKSIAGQAEFDKEAVYQRQSELRRDVKSFFAHIDFVNDRLVQIDQEIETISQQVPGPARNVLLKSLRIQKAQLESLNSKQLNDAYSMVAKVIEGIESNRYLTTTGGYSNILSEKWYDSGLKKYTHWTLNGYREDPGQIQGLFDQIVELFAQFIK